MFPSLEEKSWRRTKSFVIVFFCVLVALRLERSGHKNDFETASTFRTTDIIVDNGMTIGSGSAYFSTFAGNPNGTLTKVKGSIVLDTTNAVVYQNTNGSTAWSALGGALSAGSISMTVGSASSPIALPTLGTIDWVHNLAVGTAGSRSLTCNATTSSACWMKLNGGGRLISPGMDWVGGSFTTPSSVAGLWTFTAGSADSMTTTALSSSQVSTISASGTTGMGIRFMLPSFGNNVQSVARLYLYQYDNAAACVAIALDGTATGSGATNDTGSGGVVSQTVWTVTYKTNYGAPVVVVCIITATRTGAGNPAIGWAAESLGPT